RPDPAAAGVDDRVVPVLAGREIAHLQREIFRALVVVAPEAERMVAGMVEAGEAEIALALGFLVAVEEDGALAALARLAEIMRMLAAGDVRCAVGMRSV